VQDTHEVNWRGVRERNPSTDAVIDFIPRPGYHDDIRDGEGGGGIMPTDTQTTPQHETDIGLEQPWVVILFNDDYHSFDEVIAQVQKATGCNQAEAFQITYTAHHTGQAVAYVGERPACEQVASILRAIDLRAEIQEA
jgi:ATP-dependent Clp protease adapter protein ClpS